MIDSQLCEASGQDPWHCITHDSAWDLVKRCQKALGLPEPRNLGTEPMIPPSEPWGGIEQYQAEDR